VIEDENIRFAQLGGRGTRPIIVHDILSPTGKRWTVIGMG
jgi:hypothetical protein